MSMNATPRGERPHIALFGRRNAGKSSLVNAIANQQLAIVSEVKGTTTDPVYKAMELLPLGPVLLIDTPGLDDEGELGDLRVQKTREVLAKTDIAVMVCDARDGLGSLELDTISLIKERKLPLVIALNKCDLYRPASEVVEYYAKKVGAEVLCVSASTHEGVHELKEFLSKIVPDDEGKYSLVRDLLKPNDFVVLVVPIDSAAPKGRLILPQQQVIRDVLESGAISIVTRETELKQTLEKLGTKPRLVITDSQAFEKVSAETPKDILLTSFSILFARYKGDLEELIKGTRAIETLKDGDKVLISEGCTHHRQCDDIGTVKLPRWLSKYTGKKLEFDFSSGNHFPDNLTDFSIVVHCGACMLNRREMNHRIHTAADRRVPIVNYGVLIAYMQGILDRTIEPFPKKAEI